MHDLLLVVLGFFISLVLTAVVGNRTTDYIEKFAWQLRHIKDGDSPDCRDSGWLNLVERGNVDASATRTYTQEGQLEFVATRTLDDDASTAWAAQFDIAAEELRITWKFSRVSDPIRLLCIRNGYVGNGHVYSNNERIKSARLEGCDRPIELPFKDFANFGSDSPDPGFRKYKAVDLASCVPSKEALTLVLTETYPANDGSHQVAISDVRFFSGP